MSFRLITLSFAGLVAILATQESFQRARAQTAIPTIVATPAHSSPLSAQASDEIRSYGLGGSIIRGSDGKEVGYFREFLFTPSGQITAIVFDVGGFLGMGAKQVALPYSAFRFETVAGKVAAMRVPFALSDFKTTPKFRYLKAAEKKKDDTK